MKEPDALFGHRIFIAPKMRQASQCKCKSLVRIILGGWNGREVNVPGMVTELNSDHFSDFFIHFIHRINRR